MSSIILADLESLKTFLTEKGYGIAPGTVGAAIEEIKHLNNKIDELRKERDKLKDRIHYLVEKI